MNRVLRKDGGKRLMIVSVIGVFLLFQGVFMMFPIVYAFIGSFHEWNPLTSVFRFNEIANYRTVLGGGLFWKSLWTTFYMAGGIVVIRTALALLLAVAINSAKGLQSYFRVTYFLPVVTSVIAVSIVWKALYEPNSGFINYGLRALGLNEQAWLMDPKLVVPSIIAMTVWKDLGYAIILFLAGLQTIPPMYYEAAHIDGAGRTQLFRMITLPLLQPTTVFVVITSVIGFIQIFGQIFIMTEGGPGDASTTIVYYIYKEAFLKNSFGTASALSFLLFLILIILTYVQLKIMRRDWSY